MTPLKAIRAKCLECSNGNNNEVRLCPIESCVLWAYRVGHNPARHGHGGNIANLRKRDCADENEAQQDEEAEA